MTRTIVVMLFGVFLSGCLVCVIVPCEVGDPLPLPYDAGNEEGDER